MGLIKINNFSSRTCRGRHAGLEEPAPHHDAGASRIPARPIPWIALTVAPDGSKRGTTSPAGVYPALDAGPE